MILFKGDSLDQVITEYAPAILAYIHQAKTTGLEFIILYNENIDKIDVNRDFIVPITSMGSGDGLAAWLPNGNGVAGATGHYILSAPESLTVAEYVNHHYATTYSAQMRNAIKFHEHLQFSVSDPDYKGKLKRLTLSELVSIMTRPESCLRQNEQLDWIQCDE